MFEFKPDMDLLLPDGKTKLRIDSRELTPGADVPAPTFRNATESRWHEEDWKKAQMQKLAQEEGDVLDRMARVAARYERKTGKYRPALHRSGDDFDHFKIAFSVVGWVEDALELDTAREDRLELPLRYMVERFRLMELGPGITKEKELPTPKLWRKTTGDQAGDVVMLGVGPPAKLPFVCIDHSILAVALFRRLGYATQDVNVVSGIRLKEPVHVQRENQKPVRVADDLWTYQSAALRVWFYGQWHYFDPYAHPHTLQQTIIGTVSSVRTRMVDKIEIPARFVTHYRYGVYVAAGKVQYYVPTDDLKEQRTPWREIERGTYDLSFKLIEHHVTGE